MSEVREGKRMRTPLTLSHLTPPPKKEKTTPSARNAIASSTARNTVIQNTALLGVRVRMQKLTHFHAGDTVSSNSLLDVDLHAARQKTMRVRHFHFANVLGLFWRPRLHVHHPAKNCYMRNLLINLKKIAGQKKKSVRRRKNPYKT